jgi:hypothetical protein
MYGSAAVKFNNGRFEINDGVSWIPLPPANVELKGDDIIVLDWAREKMQEEKLIKKLIEEDATVREAYMSFRTLLALSK